MTKRLCITGARVIDSALGIDKELDVLVEGEKIAAVDSPGSFSALEGLDMISASGLILTSGLIDLHVHLREPGYEWKETVATGCNAAVAGGFTAICCMPNTNPINDNEEVTKFIRERARAAGLCDVYPIGAITMGSKGESLAPMGELYDAGCVAFSDDGKTIANANVMRKALEYGRLFNVVLAVHEEDANLACGFSMNESAMSVKLGLVGMPGAAEDVMVARDIELSRLTGAPVHFCHVSTARSVELIRRAKQDGILVTAEAAPHHFTLDDSAIGEYDVMAKMSMPLRLRADCDGVLDGLKDGTIDCIASDHAPHDLDSKRREFCHAAFGIIGLQTVVPLTLAKVRDGRLSLVRAIDALTNAPRRCFHLEPRAIAAGHVADMTLISLNQTMVFDNTVNRSKSANSPFLGETLQGVAVKTICRGHEVYSNRSRG